MAKIIKPAGKDTIDMRGKGNNKIAKFDKQLAKHAGTQIKNAPKRP